MRPVSVRIIHPGPDPDAGPLGAVGRGPRELALADATVAASSPPARGRRRDRHRAARPTRSFGARLRDSSSTARPAASSCSAPGASRWRPAPTGARSWPPRRRTTAGARQQPLLGRRRRHRAGRDALPDDPGPAGRQRPAALARGGRRLPGRRPAPALAARARHRRPARPRAPRAAEGRRPGRRRAVVIPAAHRASVRVGRGPARGAAGRRSDVRRHAGWLEAAHRRAAGRWVEERRPRATSRAHGPASRPALGPRRAPRPGRARRARAPSRPVLRCRDRRHARPAGPSPRARTRRAGRPPRTASPRTCCCRNGSPIRGSGR